MVKPEGLIFDLDGTLWDAVPTYTKAWNLVLQKHQIERVLHPENLYPLMGLQAEQYLKEVLPDINSESRINLYDEVIQKQYEIISSEGGRLFPYVQEGLEILSLQYKIIILSNCPRYIIHHFLVWSKLSSLIADHLSYGESPQSKADNMKLLMVRNNLNSAVYIGDTNSDGIQARQAGLPFIFVSYGFGNSTLYDHKFDRFQELVEWFV